MGHDELLLKYIKGEASKVEKEQVGEYLREDIDHCIHFLSLMRQVTSEELKLDETKFNTQEAVTFSSFFVNRVNQEQFKNKTSMNTLNFSVETINMMAEMAKQFLTDANKGSNVREDIVSRIQLAFVDMNAEEADNIATAIIKGVDDFNDNLNKLSDDSVNTLYSACLGTIDNRTPIEQAQTLVNFIVLLKTLDGTVAAIDSNDASILEKMEQMRKELLQEVSDNITDDELSLLKEQLREAISVSSASVAGDSRIINILKGAAFNDEIITAVADENSNLDDLKYYTALAAYILWKKGDVDEIPSDTPIELLAASVASGVEKMKIIGQAKKGLINWETALRWIKRIGSALLLTLFAWVAIKLASVIAMLSIVGAAVLLDSVIFGTIAGVILGFVISCKVLKWMYDEIPAAVIDNFIEGVEEAYTALKPMIKTTIKHLEDFWLFIKEKGELIFKVLIPTNDVVTIKT